MSDFNIKKSEDEANIDNGLNESDIIDAFDAGNADGDRYYFDSEGRPLRCTRPWTGWYRRSGSVWKICKDQDGYRVRKPNGGIDSWGTGYSWSDVKSSYGLAGIGAYKSTCGPACF
ncbi:MAG: hypothetical protein AcusKO_33730 [Acuticoccus sp.]